MKCSYCGKEEELRPYGKNGALICFDCGMKNEEETKKQFKMQMEASLQVSNTILLGEETGVRPI